MVLVRGRDKLSAQDLLGWTPLMVAARNGQREIVERLHPFAAN